MLILNNLDVVESKRTRKTVKYMITTGSDLFFTYVQQHPELFREKPLPMVQASSCAVCARNYPPFYSKKKLLKDSPNFTDVDIYANGTSEGLCASCSTMIQQGLVGSAHGKKIMGVNNFVAFGTKDDFQGTMRWIHSHYPWYRLPVIRPLFAVLSGNKYAQKHTLFRAKVSYDPQYLLVWHGDMGQLILKQEHAHQLVGLERLLAKNDPIIREEIEQSVMEIMRNEKKFLVTYTINTLKLRLDRAKKGELDIERNFPSFQNVITDAPID